MDAVNINGDGSRTHRHVRGLTVHMTGIFKHSRLSDVAAESACQGARKHNIGARNCEQSTAASRTRRGEQAEPLRLLQFFGILVVFLSGRASSLVALCLAVMVCGSEATR